MTPGFDQRKAPRVKVAMNCFFWLPLEGQAQSYAARTVNLSETGLALESNHPLQKHDILNLELALPGQQKSLSLGARVVECRFQQGKGWLYELRCVFLAPEDAAIQAIRQSLAPYTKKELGGGMATALVEERRDERAEAKLEVRFREVEDKEVRGFIESRAYMDFDTLMGSRSLPGAVSVITENISKGGLRLLAERPFGENRKLALELFLPGLNMPVHALGVILWSSPHEDLPGKHHAGLRFLAIKKDDALAVEAYVRKQGKA